VRMNCKFRLAIAVMGLGMILALPVLPCAHAQQSAPAASSTTQTSGDALSQPNKMDAPETNHELDEFRHSAAVGALARDAHLNTELAAKIFEDINSAILIGLILWLGFKVVPKMLRNRSDALQKQLFEARAATAQANERLAVVEERLSKLGIEIEAIREQTERDSVEDEKRIGAAMEAERQRIVASAEQEIELAGAAAQRELKKFAADLAVDRALERIRLTAEDDRVLIHNFGEELKAERN
jgi:F-type H+-transporting ATPase subunit b